MKRDVALILAIFILAHSCKKTAPLSDAYGNFEAREVVVAAESSGKLLRLEVEEGAYLEVGQSVGLVDTVPLHLRRLQLRASLEALYQKTQDAGPQIAVLEAQKQVLEREIHRVEVLIARNAAATKQLDDLKGQFQIVEQQILVAKSQERTANRSILSEIGPLQAQIRQLDDQIARCYLSNPVSGTVLMKWSEQSEIVIAGKPLYKIADLETMTLRAFFSGEQLPHIKIGQMVNVLVDDTRETNRTLPGRIAWISNEAEFTPRIVQTKEARVNLVYATKIQVKNDGTLKIGMPAEVELRD